MSHRPETGIENKVVEGAFQGILNNHLKSLEKKHGGRAVSYIYEQTHEGIKYAVVLLNGSKQVHSNVLPKADYSALPDKTITAMFKTRLNRYRNK